MSGYFTHILLCSLFYVVVADDDRIFRDIQAGQRHMPCRHREYLTCEIISDEDEMKIQAYLKIGCYPSDVSCSESEVKTCQPVVKVNSVLYKSFRRSLSADDREVSNANLMPWLAISPPLREFTYSRRISDSNPATEYTQKPLRFIVSHYDLDDSVFTASSHHSSCVPARSRIDAYNNYPTAWCTPVDSPGEWLHIDLLSNYVVRGVLIKERLEGPQRTEAITVKSSSDGNNWYSIITDQDIVSLYRPSSYAAAATVWFSGAVINRYWRIYVMAYNVKPAMKCDLIGYPV